MLARTITLAVALVATLFATAFPAVAADGHTPICWEFLFIELAGGLAFFLFGIWEMSDGMQKFAGERMRGIMVLMTKNRFVALLIGAFITIMINSSSATTAMLVSFVQAELLTFIQTLGVILGADIGTTVTTQLIAFKVADYALAAVAAGLFLAMFAKNDNYRNIGRAIMGFGILFHGITLMSNALHPLQECQSFVGLMKRFNNPFLGLLVGTVITAIIQSSAATIAILMTLAQSGLISLEAGIAMIFGANIGTCMTAGLASLKKSREARRVAIAHVLFKCAGVLLFIFWIPAFAGLVKTIAARFDSDMARQIANAHTIFNVTMALVFLPFTGAFAWFVYRIFPRRKFRFIKLDVWDLDNSMIATPQFAIDLARKKISGMVQLLEQMLRAVIIPFISDEKFIRREKLPPDEIEALVRAVPKLDEKLLDLPLLEGVDLREKIIDGMEKELKDYLLAILRQDLSAEQVREVNGMLAIAGDIEKTTDVAHRNLMPLIRKKSALKYDFSLEGKEELMIFHHKVLKQLSRLADICAEFKPQKARDIKIKRNEYVRLEAELRALHIGRLLDRRAESKETDEVHTELIGVLNDINLRVGHIARKIMETWNKAEIREKQ